MNKPHTLPSCTIQRSNQNLAKSVFSQLHDQSDRQKIDRKNNTEAITCTKQNGVTIILEKSATLPSAKPLQAMLKDRIHRYSDEQNY